MNDGHQNLRKGHAMLDEIAALKTRPASAPEQSPVTTVLSAPKVPVIEQAEGEHPPWQPGQLAYGDDAIGMYLRENAEWLFGEDGQP